MVLDNNQIRKLEHIDIVVNREVEGPLTNFFEYIFLIHNALPKVSPEEVNIKTRFLGRELLAPIVISGMTGGAPGTEKINEEIAKVAEEFKIAVGVGSQRAALFNPSVRDTYTIVRRICEEVPIIANIGISEVVELPLNKIEDVVNMIEADALAIHLNLPQEFVQPEGRISLSNALVKLGDLVHKLNVPIIIKEVGFGLSMEVVKRLAELGVKIFDVAGAGGTNWVVVEKYRVSKRNDIIRELIADNIKEWGIPTAASIIEARYAAPNAIIIGSGGIRTAYEAAKALRIGADLVGIARPVLLYLNKNKLREYIGAFIYSLKLILSLTNSKDLEEFKKSPIVIFGPLKEWIKNRGIKYNVLNV